MNNLYVCLAILAVGLSAVFAATTPKVCPERQACSKDLQDAYSDTSNMTKFCSAFNTTGNCFKALEHKCNMSGVIRIADEAQTKLDQVELQSGCFGKCAERAGQCLGEVTVALSSTTKYTLGLCKNVTTALHCLEGMKKDTDCKPNTAKLLFFMSKNLKEKEFSDICDDKGHRAKCFEEFNACTKDINTNKQTGAKKACKQIDTYLDCASNIDSCKSRIKAMLVNSNKYMENAETVGHCPITGTCSERIDKCVKSTKTAFTAYTVNPNKKDKDALCGDLNQATKCFDTVRKDPNCILKSGAIGDTETKGKKLYSSECDAASSLIISTALMMLGLAVSLFKNM